MYKIINIPNMISFSRLIFCYIIYLLSNNYFKNQYLIVFNYIILCYTDYLDGYYARKLNMQTTFGKFFDGFIDYLVTSLLSIILYKKNVISKNNFYVFLIITIRDTIRNFIRIKDLYNNKSNKKNISASNLGKISRVIQNIFLTISMIYPNKFMNIKNIIAYMSLLGSIYSFINYHI